jgi:hypothetical protein
MIRCLSKHAQTLLEGQPPTWESGHQQQEPHIPPVAAPCPEDCRWRLALRSGLVRENALAERRIADVARESMKCRAVDVVYQRRFDRPDAKPCLGHPKSEDCHRVSSVFGGKAAVPQEDIPPQHETAEMQWLMVRMPAAILCLPNETSPFRARNLRQMDGP